MNIYIYKDKQRIGPFDEATVRAGIDSGEYTPSTLAWQNGLPTWVPLHQLIDAQPPPIPEIADFPPVPTPTISIGTRAVVEGVFKLLSSVSLRIYAIAATVLAVMTILWVVISVRHHNYEISQPSYVIHVLDQIHTAQDVEANSQYFTAQGKQVYEWLLSKGDGSSSGSGGSWTWQAPVTTDDTYSREMVNNNSSMTVILKNNGNWQFDDLTINRIDGKEIAMNVSYMMAHPVLTWWDLNWQDLCGSFLKGFAVGAAAAGGG